MVGRDCLQPRPGDLSRGRDARRSSGAVRRRGRRGRGRNGRRGAPQRRRFDRPHRLVRRLGRQVRAGRRLRQPGRGAVLQLLTARADRRGGRHGATGVEPAGLRQRARAGALHRQHGCHRGLGAQAAARRLALRGPRDLGSARRRGQRADRLHERARALARESSRRQRDRPDRRRWPPTAPTCSEQRPTTSSASTSPSARTGRKSRAPIG